MRLWRNVRYILVLAKNPSFEGGTGLLSTIISSSLIVLLFSTSILSPMLQSSLSEVEAKSIDKTSPEGKKDDLRTDVFNMAKKLRGATGEKTPNDYIVVLKDNNFLSSVRSLAVEVRSEGAALRHIYDHSLHGIAIRVPNDKVLEEILQIPEVDYVQPDVKVKAFAQSLPTGVNRVDGDSSSTKSGDGKGTVNVDIGIVDSGIERIQTSIICFRNKER
jgi:Peptidase inhibitor I9